MGLYLRPQVDLYRGQTVDEKLQAVRDLHRVLRGEGQRPAHREARGHGGGRRGAERELKRLAGESKRGYTSRLYTV